MEKIDLSMRSFFDFEQDKFLYRAPFNSNEFGISERGRISHLEELLRYNKICGNGYEILEKKEITKFIGSIGYAGDVVYKGKCK
jgi:hypothetical protein